MKNLFEVFILCYNKFGDNMKIERIITGELEENCYLVSNENHLFVVDPGSDYPKIRKMLNGRKVDFVLVTHHHFDHVGALADLLKEYSVPVFDKSNMVEQEYQKFGFYFSVIATPGHTSDSISFYFPKENILFSGDFLFLESVGRWDLPTGDINAMAQSITKIKKLSDDCKVYPGHGDLTTIEHEKKYNYYFQNV